MCLPIGEKEKMKRREIVHQDNLKKAILVCGASYVMLYHTIRVYLEGVKIKKNVMKNLTNYT